MRDVSHTTDQNDLLIIRYNDLQAFVRRIRILLAIIPALIILPVLWFTSIEVQRTAAKIQFILEASKAGLLNNPYMEDLATVVLGGNLAYTIFLAFSAVIFIMCLAMHRKSRQLIAPGLPSEGEEASLPHDLLTKDQCGEVANHALVVAASVTPYYATPHESWQKHAYPLHLMTIQAQGTRHSTREDMIVMLEKGLARLKAGEESGLESDDDFGYRFVEKTEMDLSIFGEPASM
jgi:hypothetical protein